MADKRVNIDPRYISYSSKEVDAILHKVEKVEDTLAEDSDYPVSSRGVAAELYGEYYDQ